MTKRTQFQFVMAMPDNMIVLGNALPVFPARTPQEEKAKIKVKTERDYWKISSLVLVILTFLCVCILAYQYHVNKIERIESRLQSKETVFKPIATTTPTPVNTPTPKPENPIHDNLHDLEEPTATTAKVLPSLPKSEPIKNNPVANKPTPPKLEVVSKKVDLPTVQSSVKTPLPQFIIADTKPNLPQEKNSIFKRNTSEETKAKDAKPSADSPGTQKMF